MYALIGIAAVFAAVLGGFLLENGNPYVLFQPAELLIVGGAAAGIVMVANPPSVMRKMWRGCLAAFRPPSRTPQAFLRNMRMLYEIFTFIQRAGIMEFEQDVEDPGQQPHLLQSSRFSATTSPPATSSAIRCACWWSA